MLVDAHAHFLPAIKGRKGEEPTAAGNYGKVLIGGMESQVLPVYLKDSTFPVDMLLATMDANNVGRAILLQNPFYGIINDEISDAVRAYPDRFKGTIQADPYGADALSEIRRYHAPGQYILKFEISEGWGWSSIHRNLLLDGPEFMAIWELATELGLCVIIDPGRINNPGYQVEALERITRQFSQVKFLIEHLGYMTADLYGDNSAHETWRRMIRLGREENVFIGFSAIFILLEEDYPCPRSVKLLEEAVNTIGAEKILWGTDIPTTLSRYTYGQMIDLIVKHAGFLSDTQKDMVMGFNALDFLDWT